MDDDEAVKLPVTPLWLKSFKAAFDELPQGDKQKLADFADCTPSLLSRIANGEVASSARLAKISDYLKIAPPAVVVDSLLQAKLMTATSGMSEEDLNLLISNANRMRR